MRTIVLGPRPPELDALIARRHALGHDTHDEVWEGEYHMAPAPHQRHGLVAWRIGRVLDPLALDRGMQISTEFNLGRPDDYRVPDLGIFRGDAPTMFVATAAMVIEVVSPGDESWLKFDHYAAHRVDEVLIANPDGRSIAIFVLGSDGYVRTDHSALLGISAADIHDSIDWPDSDQ